MPTEQEKLQNVVRIYIRNHIHLDKRTAIVFFTRPDDNTPWNFHSVVQPIDVEWTIQRLEKIGGLKVKYMPSTDIWNF